MKVSILIPVYNEFRTFPQVLERVRQAPLPAGCTREIIVIDDGSTDGTAQILGEHARAGIIAGHRSAVRMPARVRRSAPASRWLRAISC